MPSTKKTTQWPAVSVGSYWEHRNGQVYVVDEFRNTETTNPEKYPVMICYHNRDTGSKWVRPLSDWLRSMTPHKAEKVISDLKRVLRDLMKERKEIKKQDVSVTVPHKKTDPHLVEEYRRNCREAVQVLIWLGEAYGYRG